MSERLAALQQKPLIHKDNGILKARMYESVLIRAQLSEFWNFVCSNLTGSDSKEALQCEYASAQRLQERFLFDGRLWEAPGHIIKYDRFQQSVM